MSRVSLQIFFIAGFAFALFIGWDFSQRVMLTVRLQQTEQQLDQQIARAQATHTALVELKNRVQTDDFIERKLRQDFHYVRDKEIVVIPLITPAAPQQPPEQALTPATSVPQTNWWQDLIEFLLGP